MRDGFEVTHLWLSERHWSFTQNGLSYEFVQVNIRPVNVEKTERLWHVETEAGENFSFETLPQDVVALADAAQHPYIKGHDLCNTPGFPIKPKGGAR